jgi:hypothetical protein
MPVPIPWPVWIGLRVAHAGVLEDRTDGAIELRRRDVGRRASRTTSIERSVVV